MPSLTVRDLPEDTMSTIRMRAARHHRSLNGEILHIFATVASFGDLYSARETCKKAFHGIKYLIQRYAAGVAELPCVPLPLVMNERGLANGVKNIPF